MHRSRIAIHFGLDFERRLRAAVARALRKDENALAEPWRELDAKVSDWLEIHSSTSLLLQRLLVLETLCELFPREELHGDPAIAEIVLADTGLAAVGDTLATGTVVARSISPRFGIQFSVRRNDGTVVTHEWFD